MASLHSFVRSRGWGVGVFLVLAVLAWFLHAAHDIALVQPGWFSGWALVALMVFLTLYNLRKKLDFLPSVLSSRHWLWAHLVFGYLSIVLFVLHVGARVPEGPLEIGLWLQFVGVVGSGCFGHYISRRYPQLLAERGNEVLYERAPHLLRRTRELAEDASLRAARQGDSSAIPEFYRDRLADFFAGPSNRLRHLMKSRRPLEELLRGLDALERVVAREEVELVEELREAVIAKDDLDFHTSHQAVLKGWLLVHVPLAYSLLVVMVLHVVLVYAFGGVS